MAPSLFQGNRIREHKATKYQGKPLVYGIGTNDPKACNLALQAHDFVYSLSLSEEQKRALNPKWMGQVIKAMVRAQGRGQWKEILTQYLLELPTSEPAPNPPIGSGENQNPRVPKTAIGDLIQKYNYTLAHLHYGPYFPGATTDPGGITKLIDHLLVHGTLMQSLHSLEPTPGYEALIANCPTSQLIRLRMKVVDIQALLRHGRYWETFCQAKKVLTIEDFDSDHGKGYIAWRKGTRFHGQKGKAISTNILKKELGYFRALCQYAVKKRLIAFNPMDGVKPSRMEVRGQGNQNLPLSYPNLLHVLEKVMSKYIGSMSSPTLSPQRIVDVKWNFHAVLFLLCTGCRPSEVQKWEVAGDHIQFFKTGKNTSEGKTKHSSRKVPITNTLRMIIEDGTLLSQPCLSITARLHQFLKRLQLEVTPYQFRHTVSTLLFKISELPNSEISYRLGHATVDFSYRQYTDLDCFADTPTETLKFFWDSLNTGIPEEGWQFTGTTSFSRLT